MKVIGIAGFSGSGKTTLIEKVIPVLVRAGLRVSLIKHAHHEFDVDQPGKDSYRHRHAGCAEVLVTSSTRWALMHELRGAAEPTLQDQLKHLSACDVVIVEGFKSEPIPKVEVHRRDGMTPLLYPNDPNVVAVATDEPLDTTLPQLDVDDPEAVAHFLVHHLGLDRARLVRQVPVVTLLYFASLRESLGTSREQVALPAGTATVATLVDSLRSRDGRYSEAFASGKPWRVAVNQQMANPGTPVKPGDEVAFFPPVTGG